MHSGPDRLEMERQQFRRSSSLRAEIRPMEKRIQERREEESTDAMIRIEHTYC